MRNRLNALYLFSAFAITLPMVASAQQLAYASKTVSMRAGPSRDYPVVATSGSGTALTIYGCLQGYKWCDVVVGNSRGWVYSGNIIYPYLGRNVPVITYGTTIGLGIVSFSIGNYWDNYYTDYPWYSQRQNWSNRPWAGYGSGYGSGYNWRAPTAQVRPVTPAVRPVAPNLRPPAQVSPVRPQLQQAVPLRAPPAQVQGVGRPLPPGQAQQCGPNDPNCGRARQGTH
jgi:uncharacterized protein YraI